MSALSLSRSILLASIIWSVSFYRAQRDTHIPSVAVKGLAEREVAADLSVWPLSIVVLHNDLDVAYATMEKQRATLVEFLQQAGFETGETSFAPPIIEDRAAEASERHAYKYRYKGTLKAVVTTTKVNKVQSTRGRIVRKLLARGVVLDSSRPWDRENRVRFLFTKLNEIKPGMISEATKNAKTAAMQFAEDAGSRVGTIYRAQQGYFNIQDTERPTIKRIRVITNVTYTLRK